MDFSKHACTQCVTILYPLFSTKNATFERDMQDWQCLFSLSCGMHLLIPMKINGPSEVVQQDAAMMGYETPDLSF